MNVMKFSNFKPDLLLLGCLLLAAAAVLPITWQELLQKGRRPDPRLFCEQIVQPKAELTAEKLAKVLTVRQPSKRSKVQDIVNKPYCRMPSLSFRNGAITERHAYPLAFEEQMWLVILYEGDNYVGYGFKRF